MVPLGKKCPRSFLVGNKKSLFPTVLVKGLKVIMLPLCLAFLKDQFLKDLCAQEPNHLLHFCSHRNKSNGAQESSKQRDAKALATNN
jgi:hypothetical protein